MMTFSPTGSSSNNAVGYEKHHHKHLGWRTFPATLRKHIKSQRPLHLFLFSERSPMSFVVVVVACTQISLTWATNITQPQILTQFCSISSHHSRFRIRSDHFTWPTVSTSSLKSIVLQPQLWCPLENKSDVPTVYSQRKKVPLSGVGWSCGQWREQVIHQMPQMDSWQPCLLITKLITTDKNSLQPLVSKEIKHHVSQPCPALPLCLLDYQRVCAKTFWSKTWEKKIEIQAVLPIKSKCD